MDITNEKDSSYIGLGGNIRAYIITSNYNESYLQENI